LNQALLDTGAQLGQPSTEKTKVTESANKHTVLRQIASHGHEEVAIKAGEKFERTFQGNQGTCTWISVVHDKTVLIPIEQRFSPTHRHSPKGFNVPGSYYFQWVAANAGKTSIALRYGIVVDGIMKVIDHYHVIKVTVE